MLNAYYDGHRVGSSPLTRGKRRTRSWQQESRGLIPAHAGKTAEFFGAGDAGAAHPRSRGENACMLILPIAS